jgi:GMP synthase-like glutamine amidotransferase
MHLAILMSNTDDSPFAQEHPDDGQKFTALLHRVRPNWQIDVFTVKDGVFPENFDFNGFLITGSPASVHDDAAWIPKLEELVQQAIAKQIPMFGACFGHQIIAKALGAPVEKNPTGWVLGRLETQFEQGNTSVPMYAAHKEQVTSLPNGAHRVAQTEGCPIAGFAIKDHVLTTQYHPEMDQQFVTALLDAFADEIGRDVTTAAAKTLTSETDLDALAEWIAAFFERGRPPVAS